MPYHQLFYHLVWGTRGREPWLTSAVEPLAHQFIREKSLALGGTVFGVNGMQDHVHLLVSIPPKRSVADFVGQVKSISSTLLNRCDQLAHRFAWQSEYGAFSLDRKRLPALISYVEQQKEHHAQARTIAILERY